MSSCSARLLAFLTIFPGLLAAGVAGDDKDGDGVDDLIDVCPNTPGGILVDAAGRPVENLDGDCDIDLEDFAMLQVNLFELDDLAALVADMRGPLPCEIAISDNDIELRFVMRTTAIKEGSACTVPLSEVDYLTRACLKVQIFARDTSPDPHGIECAYVNFELGDAACPFSGRNIVVANRFPRFQSGCFDGPPIRAVDVGGCAAEAGAGVDEWVLLATIELAAPASSCAGTVMLSEADKGSTLYFDDAPADMGLSDPLAADIQCAGLIYDLWPPGGDGFINAADRSPLTLCMGEVAPFVGDCALVDYNCDGSVDEIDGSYFDSAWQQGICSGAIDIPPCQLSCK